MPFPRDAPKKIKDKMDAGLLPRDAPPKMFASYGNSEPCAGCDTPILPNQVEFEFEAADATTVRFHLGCAGLWEAERRQHGWDRRNGQQAVEARTEPAHQPTECAVCRKHIAAETGHYRVGDARVHVECMVPFRSGVS